MSTKTRMCLACDTAKPESEFYKNGKYRRSYCKTCDNDRRKQLPTTTPTEQQKETWQSRRRKRVKAQRKDPNHQHKFIYYDSRKSDKKYGRKNDLTKEYIAEQIAKGCSYCGEKNLRITLDRIDNNIGHLMTNTVPACIRCNYVRGSMPYEAWLCLKPGLRRARKQGLFGDWTRRMK